MSFENTFLWLVAEVTRYVFYCLLSGLVLQRTLSIVAGSKAAKADSPDRNSPMKCEKGAQYLANSLRTHCPAFPVPSRAIKVLGANGPADFMAALQAGLAGAEKRVLLSSLYFGRGKREETLRDELSGALGRGVESWVVMDRLRARRGADKGLDSVSFLRPLVEKGLNLALVGSPANAGSFWGNLPSKLAETGGVHHMKAYIFDNRVILSGANLNDTYLNNRLDRYVEVEDEGLSDHIYDMLVELAGVSQRFESVGEIERHQVVGERMAEVVSRFTDPSGRSAKQTGGGRKSTSSVGSVCFDSCDTWLFFSAHIPGMVRHEEKLMKILLETPGAMRVSTAYLNPGAEVSDLLASRRDLTVLTAAPRANSFFTLAGGAITDVYRHYAAKLAGALRFAAARVVEAPPRHPGWTFHAKGLWLAEFHSGGAPYASWVCSSNLGRRSDERDTEASVVFVTRDSALQKAFQNEWEGLAKGAMPVVPRRHAPTFLTRVLAKIMAPIL